MNAKQHAKTVIPAPHHSGTSFGLHSPDFIPSLNNSENNILATLKNLQNGGEYQLPFVDTTIYLDPDIIDLTVIPPPITPEADTFMNGMVHPFAMKEPPTLYSQDFNSNLYAQNNEANNLSCDNLDSQTQANLMPNTALESLHSFSQNLDEFIASVTIPPPPVDSESNLIYSNLSEKEQINCDYLNSLIIPPPPCSNHFNEQQNEVIDRFWKATDAMKKICNKEEPSFKLSTRDLHSSSSADSGYDSVTIPSSINSSNQNEWSSVCYDHTNFSKPSSNSKETTVS
jgi:hypothetical protein